MSTQDRKICFQGHQIFVGLDVHKNSWQVSVLLKNVAQKTYHMAPGSPATLQSYLHKNFPGGEYLCAYEAGFSGFWIQEELTRLGIKTVIYHASDIPTSDKEKRQKTDQRDSLKIAKALRKGDCEPIFIPDQEQQELRRLVRHRANLVKDRQRVMHRIKGHLQFVGIHPDPSACYQQWSGKYLQWLADQAKQREDLTLGSMLNVLKDMRRHELDVLKQLRLLSQTKPFQPAMKLLLSVPGVGIVSSLVILSEIGVDFNRFTTFDCLCAYCGLMPDTKSSGDSERVGDITNRGNRRLRTTLIECAWVAIKHDRELGLYYNTCKNRMAGQKAIVKVARKLLNRIRRVMIYKEAYTMAQAT
jgi:transposase